MKVSLFILKFLFVGALFIIANEQLHINDSQDREIFFNHFYGWFDQLYQQSLNIVGYVTNSEWLPEDEKTPNLDRIG